MQFQFSAQSAVRNESALRNEVRQTFDDVRDRIRGYTGLYSDEDLLGEVMCACDEAMGSFVRDMRLEDIRQIIETRCQRLAEAANRFGERDPTVIAAARAQAVAAIDMLQDAVFQLRRTSNAVSRFGCPLKRRSL
jgi:hypothetical protein